MEAVTALLSSLSVLFLLLHAKEGRERRSTVLGLLGLERRVGARRAGRGRLAEAAVGKVRSLGKRLPAAGDARLSSLLAESGVPWDLAFLKGMSFLGAAACASLFLPLGWRGLLLALPAAAAAYRLPLLYLAWHSRRRRLEAALDLPEVADLISVLCLSGESLGQALRHSVAVCSHQASRSAMEAVCERIKLGERMGESLSRLVDHPCREMRRFGRAILRAQESGAPVADILQELASEMRAARRERNRVRAARTSVMVLFPLVFMILPSFLLLTVGSMVLGYAR